MIDYRDYYASYTSPEITERKQEEAKGFLLDRMSAAVLGTAGAVGAYYGGAFKVFPNVLDRRLKGNSIFEHTTNSNSKALQSALLTLEELSPLHIAKTLGLSSYQIAFAEVIDKSKRVIISSQSIRAYSDYYKALILNSSGYALKPVDIQNGFIYENNKLYLANRNGTRGREILGYANFVTANTEIGAQDSPNKVFQKFANRQGVRVHLSQAKLEPLVLIGGKDKASTMLEWHKAFGMFNMEIGLKVLDHPFAFIQETLGNMGINTDEMLRKNKLLTAISNKMDLGLGTNGDYTLGIRKSLYKMSQNIGIKATGAYTSYVTMNWILEKLTPEESTWHDGIFAGLAANYARARVAFAQSWSDAFQGYKEMQEEAAPESTSLLTLLGFPLSGAMVGATAAYAHRMKDTFTKGLEEAALSHTAPVDLVAQLRGTTLSRYSKLGGLVGAALALPFLPGALIGRSSEELRAEYTGEADVAVRKNRGWLFSSEPWEGGQVKYFRKSLIREIISDARNKTLYENGDQQRDMDPLYSPLEYLRNPYAFEEAHQDDMPTPIWGMEITYGSFLGKLFQTTIGQVIKPTIINPALTGEQDTGAITRYTEGVLSKAYAYPIKETRRDKSLQNAGMMLESPSAVTDQSKEGLVGAYAAASDFAGLKGFFGSLLLKSVGLDPAEQMAPKLQVSGSLNTIVERYQSAQLGDAFGAGEFIRRLMPQSADTKRESVNPLRNKTGNYIEFLPKDTHRDFGEGSYYHKHEAGYTMLPGTRGFDELHPELKGIDPNDYSDAWKYRILQNVARGSKEHLTYRAHLIKNLDKLSDYDKDVFFTAYEQDMARGEEKKFFEYKTDEERARFSVPQRLLNTLWENIAHSEPATEMLTPFRPMGKFVHQRSAIEDYQHTQLGGSDVAIWTKPYDHFIKPFINKSIQMVDGDFKPQEAKDKEAIDEYFDKLKHLKSIGFVDTVVEAAYSGMRTEKDMAAFKRALPDNQKAYVEAFSKEKNEEKRKQILALLPSDVGRVYEQIWENIDAYEAGGERAVKDLYLKETETLKRELNIQLSEEEVRRINKRTYKAKNREEEVALQQAALIRSKAAKREAEAYVEGEPRTGSSWVGWDPRLTSDDIKLRTLSVGGEDLQKFGFWKKDIQRNERIIALDGNELDLDTIKKRLREYQDAKHLLKRKLREQGFTVDSISTSAGAGEVNINVR